MKRQHAANDRNVARYLKAKDEALPWRDYLTPEEAATIAAADASKTEWQRLNAARAGIVNRAIQRAKYKLGLR